MQKKVRIIVDSASDMAATRPELTVLPMTVAFGGEEYLDGVTLTHTAFYEKLVESDALPTTSQLTPHAFEQAFRAALEAGEEPLAVTLSSRLSGTHESALLAARACGAPVRVVDSATVCVGERILVEYALRLLDEGLDAAAIAEALEQKKRDIRLLGVKITPALVFLGIVALTTALELLASYLMEALLGGWQWDYTRFPLNFQGRIALNPSLRFGLGGMVFLYLLQPLFGRLLGRLSPRGLRLLAGALALLMGADALCCLLFRLL